MGDPLGRGGRRARGTRCTGSRGFGARLCIGAAWLLASLGAAACADAGDYFGTARWPRPQGEGPPPEVAQPQRRLIPVTFHSSFSDERWFVQAGESGARCQLPCGMWVPPTSDAKVRLGSWRNGRVDHVIELDGGDLAEHEIDPVSVRVDRKESMGLAGGLIGGGLGAMGVGGALFAVGVSGFYAARGDCRDDSLGPCAAGAAFFAVGMAMVAIGAAVGARTSYRYEVESVHRIPTTRGGPPPL